MARDAVLELRQYMLKPGRRQALMDLFDEALVDAQEAVGMAILGRFADADDDDRFIWLRGFSDPAARADQLQAFYTGPVWRAHRERANATMISSDDVLMLSPAFADGRFRLTGQTSAADGAVPVSELHVLSLAQPAGEAALDHFERVIVPAAAADGLAVTGCYVTAPGPNAFPALPVREHEHVLVWAAERDGEPDGGSGALRSAEATAPGLIAAPTVRRLGTGAERANGIAPARTGDGRDAFNFLRGAWRVENWKLVNPLEPEDQSAVTFAATVVNRPLLAGLGNVDDYRAPEMPGRPGFAGMALRLYDPESGLWRVWWGSTAGAGRLDTPVSGPFTGDHARFEAREVLNGTEVGVRYQWWRRSATRADWEQSFALDGPDSWRPNWRMRWFRAD